VWVRNPKFQIPNKADGTPKEENADDRMPQRCGGMWARLGWWCRPQSRVAPHPRPLPRNHLSHHHRLARGRGGQTGSILGALPGVGASRLPPSASPFAHRSAASVAPTGNSSSTLWVANHVSRSRDGIEMTSYSCLHRAGVSPSGVWPRRRGTRRRARRPTSPAGTGRRAPAPAGGCRCRRCDRSGRRLGSFGANRPEGDRGW
jgi:hypothetical protein